MPARGRKEQEGFLPGVPCFSEREGRQKHSKAPLTHRAPGCKGRLPSGEHSPPPPAACTAYSPQNPQCKETRSQPGSLLVSLTAAEQLWVLVPPAGRGCESLMAQHRAASYLPCELVPTLGALKLPHSLVPADVDTQLLDS